MSYEERENVRSSDGFSFPIGEWVGLVVASAACLVLTACGYSADDSSNNDWEDGDSPARDLERVEKTNGHYIVSAGAPPGFTIAAMGEAVDCGFYEQDGFEEPALMVSMSSYYAEEFEVVPLAINRLAGDQPEAKVVLSGLRETPARKQPMYSAVEGTVELTQDVRNDGSPVEVKVDARFTEPLIAEKACPSGSQASQPPTCTCVRGTSGETFECTRESGEPTCCYDQEHYDSSYRIRETLQFERCGE